MQVVSVFFSDDEKRSATVYHVSHESVFQVTAKSDTGSSFRSQFDNLKDAETYAKGWVK